MSPAQYSKPVLIGFILGAFGEWFFVMLGSSIEPRLPRSPKVAAQATTNQAARLSHASVATSAALGDTNERAQGRHLVTLETDCAGVAVVPACSSHSHL